VVSALPRAGCGGAGRIRLLNFHGKGDTTAYNLLRISRLTEHEAGP
jgi:hypothetical protein